MFYRTKKNRSILPCQATVNKFHMKFMLFLRNTDLKTYLKLSKIYLNTSGMLLNSNVTKSITIPFFKSSTKELKLDQLPEIYEID